MEHLERNPAQPSPVPARRPWFWGLFALFALLALSAVAPSRVSMTDPPMSFVTFLSKVRWGRLLSPPETAEGLAAVVVGFSLVAAYSIARTRRRRFALAALGALSPVLVLSYNNGNILRDFGLMLLYLPDGAPRMLAGQGDGVFYSDGPYLFTALGAWTVFCVGLALYEIRSSSFIAGEDSEKRSV